jgi:hypothetical protein
MLYIGVGSRGLVVATVCESLGGKRTPLTTVSSPCFEAVKAAHSPTYESL